MVSTATRSAGAPDPARGHAADTAPPSGATSSGRARPAPPAPALDRDAAERVLRRAIELGEQADAPHDTVDISSLLAAAEELDVPADGILRAAAEEQLGLLRPDVRRGDRLLGPDQVVVARVVDGTPGDVLERLDAWMRLGRVLRRRRCDADRAVYTRRSDPVAVAQRAVRAVRGSERLARVRRLEAAVTAVGPDRSLVVLRVDTSASRITAAAGGATVAGSGALTSAVAAVDWTAWAWLGVPVAVAGGVGVAAARRAYLADVDEDLESVLDGLASGGAPTSLLESVAARFVASAARVTPGWVRSPRPD